MAKKMAIKMVKMIIKKILKIASNTRTIINHKTMERITNKLKKIAENDSIIFTNQVN
jgi:hypothetical protein